MGNFFKKPVSYERGRQMLLFLFCLFLAFVIWSVHKLSFDYSHLFQYNVIVKSTLPGRSGDAVSDNLLTVRGRASGFYILQQKYGVRGKNLYISPDNKFLRRVPGEQDRFYILSGEIRDIISEGLGDKVTLEYISSDTITLAIPRRDSRQ